jgi:hypothetical protein
VLTVKLTDGIEIDQIFLLLPLCGVGKFEVLVNSCGQH